MSKLKFVFGIVAIGLVSGCGGSGGGEASRSFSEIANELDSITDTLAGKPLFEPANLPTTGGSTYRGAIGMMIGDGTAYDQTLVGELEITTTLSNSSVGGVANDFVSPDDQAYGGSLSLQNGFIDRVSDPVNFFGMGAVLEGSLVAPDGERLVSNAELVGDFYGDDYEHIAGFVQGSLDGYGEELNIDQGEFITTR